MHLHSTNEKIFTWQQLEAELMRWRLKDDVIVFTNGCFDLLHRGHAQYLEDAKKCGTRLVVGINSDSSPFFKTKGDSRPFVDQNSRAILIAALQSVDAVVIFDEETPEKLIELVRPNVLVKGGDYKISEIAGATLVQKAGGRVELIPFVDGFSSSRLIEKIRKA